MSQAGQWPTTDLGSGSLDSRIELQTHLMRFAVASTVAIITVAQNVLGLESSCRFSNSIYRGTLRAGASIHHAHSIDFFLNVSLAGDEKVAR